MLLPSVCHLLIFLHVLSSTSTSPIPLPSATLPSLDSLPHPNTTYPSFLFSNSSNMGNEGMVWLPFRQSELKGLLFDLPWLVETTRTVLLKWIIRKCLYMSNNHSDICSLKGICFLLNYLICRFEYCPNSLFLHCMWIFFIY